jgi:hypothetical protein
VAILMSLIFAFITNSQELLLYRHLPYIFEPITILAAVGIVKFFDLQASKKNSKMILLESNDQVIHRNNSNYKPEIVKKKVTDGAVYIKNVYSSLPSRFAFAGFISILIVICGLYSYPPLEVVSGFEEGTSSEEFDSCFWLRENLPESATVASDHRMSSMVFGFSGLNASWEYAPKIMHGESYEEIRSELEEANIPSGNKRIDYILISKAIKNGVALKQWETAEPMSDEALLKFEKEPFFKIYDNGEVQVYYYVSSAAI